MHGSHGAVAARTEVQFEMKVKPKSCDDSKIAVLSQSETAYFFLGKNLALKPIKKVHEKCC